MKKVNLNGKLTLKKETIAKLNNDEMKKVVGGETEVCKTNSYDASACCPTAYLVATQCPVCG